MCPPGVRITDIENIEDVLDLPADPYVSDDVALLRHRSRARQVQSRAFDKRDLNNPPNSGGNDKWTYIAAISIVIAGVIAVVMTTEGRSMRPLPTYGSNERPGVPPLAFNFARAKCGEQCRAKTPKREGGHGRV